MDSFYFYLVTDVIGKFLSVIFLIVYLYTLHRGCFFGNQRKPIWDDLYFCLNLELCIYSRCVISKLNGAVFIEASVLTVSINFPFSNFPFFFPIGYKLESVKENFMHNFFLNTCVMESGIFNLNRINFFWNFLSLRLWFTCHIKIISTFLSFIKKRDPFFQQF